MADLYKNVSKRRRNLVSGFSLDPGEKKTLPHHVVKHPHTQAQINAGRLALIVEAKGTKAKKAAEPVEEAPEAEFTPASSLPEGATVVDGDDVYKVGSVKRGRPSKRTVKTQDKTGEPEAPEVE